MSFLYLNTYLKLRKILQKIVRRPLRRENLLVPYCPVPPVSPSTSDLHDDVQLSPRTRTRMHFRNRVRRFARESANFRIANARLASYTDMDLTIRPGRTRVSPRLASKRKAARRKYIYIYICPLLDGGASSRFNWLPFVRRGSRVTSSSLPLFQNVG